MVLTLPMIIQAFVCSSHFVFSTVFQYFLYFLNNQFEMLCELKLNEILKHEIPYGRMMNIRFINIKIWKQHKTNDK